MKTINFWLENETYITPYNMYVMVDDSDYDGYYGAESVIIMDDMEFISIAELVYGWMNDSELTEEELKAAEQFMAPVKHLFDSKNKENE